MKNMTVWTRAYLIATWIVGAILFAVNMAGMNLDRSEWLLLAGLVVMASFSQVYRVDGTTNRSHYAVSFVFYSFAFLKLGVPAALVVILLSNLVEWIYKKSPVYISAFNASCYVISIQFAALVYSTINPSGYLQSWLSVAAILVAMTGYNLVNHIMVGIIIWMARGETFAKSGIFDLLPLVVDLTMLVMGASLNYVWNYNPYAVLLFAIPLYLIYSTLRVPALQRRADTDQKTGIYNHAYFIQQFQNELTRADRYDRPLVVLLADLDLLRNINNTYGHIAGDEVIQRVAKIIQSSVREYDIVARFGGEEFTILMPETPLDVATERAELIRNAIQAHDFAISTHSQPLKITISLGVAGRERSGQTTEEILHNADLALYRSKDQGRNATYVFVNGGFQIKSPVKINL
jgi:diguanylate cyclase (GGDEF)-like protein